MRVEETYKGLYDAVADWADGLGVFMVVTGRGGLGKSWAYEHGLRAASYHLIKNHTTPLALYKELWESRNDRIVFDDCDSLLADNSMVGLLKSLCNSRPTRTVQWNTTSRLLGGVPTVFDTTSPVLLVTNHEYQNVKDPDIKALLDRAGDCLEFDPSKREVLRKLASYAKDKEVLTFLRKQPVIPSLRIYEKTVAIWKPSKRRDWQDVVMRECGAPRAVIDLLALRKAHKGKPEKELVRLWGEKYGRSRSDYFNQLKVARDLELAEEDSPESIAA